MDKPLPTFAVVVLVLAGASGCGANEPDAGPSSARRTTAPALPVLKSSLVDGSSVDGGVPWTATVTPSTDISEVRFTIDGQQYWTEHNAPYDFNDANGLLSTWLLPNGSHQFTATAVTRDGATVSSTSTVTIDNVGVAAVPAVIGTWARTTTAADNHKVRDEPGYDPAYETTDNGRWTLTFRRDGLLVIKDPNGGGIDYQVRVEPGGKLTAYGPANWTLPPPADSSPLYGYFCEHVEEGLDTFTWSVTGTALSIDGGKTCAFRDALFRGEWTRVG